MLCTKGLILFLWHTCHSSG